MIVGYIVLQNSCLRYIIEIKITYGKKSAKQSWIWVYFHSNVIHFFIFVINSLCFNSKWDFT